MQESPIRCNVLADQLNRFVSPSSTDHFLTPPLGIVLSPAGYRTCIHRSFLLLVRGNSFVFLFCIFHVSSSFLPFLYLLKLKVVRGYRSSPKYRSCVGRSGLGGIVVVARAQSGENVRLMLSMLSPPQGTAIQGPKVVTSCVPLPMDMQNLSGKGNSQGKWSFDQSSTRPSALQLEKGISSHPFYESLEESSHWLRNLNG